MKWLALLWAVLAMGCAAAMSAGYGPDVRSPDWVHWVGHLVLFGGLAWMLDRSLGWRPTVTLFVATGVGVGVELAQVVGSGSLSPGELVFDTMVDALAAMAGLAWGRRIVTAQAMGWWLHPALVFPLGLFGTFYAALRDVQPALAWTLLAVASLLPAAIVWLLGVRRGWFGSLDLVSRGDRPRLFALACGCCLLFVALAHLLGAPGGVLGVAHGFLLTSVLITALTATGLKVSGHVTIALLLAVAIAPWSIRGPVLFLSAGILLSWCRVRSRCHRPIEVVGAWALSAVVFLPTVLLPLP